MRPVKEGLIILFVTSLSLIINADSEKLFQEALNFFNKNFASKNPNDRAEAVRKLGNATFKKYDLKTVHMITFMLQQELSREQVNSEENVAPQVLNECVWALKKITDEKATAYLYKFARNKKQYWRLRYYIAKGIPDPPPDNEKDYIKLMEDLLREKSPQLQLCGVYGLYRCSDKASIEIAHALIKEITRSWELRLGALELIERFKDQSSTDHLIETLSIYPPEEKRLRFKIVNILKQLTEIDMDSDNAGNWRTLWNQKKEGKLTEPLSTNGTTLVEFYGLKGEAGKVVFVIDNSSSMLEMITTAVKEKYKSLFDLEKNNGNKEKNLKLDPKQAVLYEKIMDLKENFEKRIPKTKLDLLKRELAQTIVNLDEQSYFNIIWFDTTARPWKESLLNGTLQNKFDALSALQTLTPTGATNLWDAIEMAFKITRQRGKNNEPSWRLQRSINYAHVMDGVETIFLLTDGVPNMGRIKDRERIVQEIEKMNDTRRITINIICTSNVEEKETSYLRNISDITEGEFEQFDLKQ